MKTYLILISLFFTSYSQFTRETDSLALVAIYNATQGWNWTNPWMLTANMDEWEGVYFPFIPEKQNNPKPRVIILELENRNLNGILPAELLNLDQLF